MLSRASRPPFRAVLAISLVTVMSSARESVLKIKALTAILIEPKNCATVNFMRTTKTLPPMTMSIEGAFTNRPIPPPKTIAERIMAKAPTTPSRVAKSTGFLYWLLLSVAHFISCGSVVGWGECLGESKMSKASVNFSGLLKALQEKVELLEKPDVELEVALAEFEAGMALAKQCRDYLLTAKQKVEVLTQSAGELSVQEFSSGAEDE